MIELDDVSVVVASGSHDRTILHPTTLTLAERRIAIIGANGSGKSTFARLLNGLTLPSTGSVTVDGDDTASAGAAVRARVGFLFADADAQLVMPTPIEDVSLSLRRLRLPGAQREARARAVLRRFHLDDLADTPVQVLSGGQKQLLAIAGVLVTEPEVLVCDEPTTRLDLRWRGYVDAFLASLPQQVILVTHDLDAAAQCERGIVIDDGRVVVDATGSVAVDRYRELAAGAPLARATPSSESSSTSLSGPSTASDPISEPLSGPSGTRPNR